MTIFVDTSGLFALLDRDDPDHGKARDAFPNLLRSDELLTHNYVVVETAAVVHRRLGPEIARTFLEDVAPVMRVIWVDEDVQRAALSAFLAAIRRRPSLVDWVSFEVMRRRGLDRAFAFDRDFELQGFRTVP